MEGGGDTRDEAEGLEAGEGLVAAWFGEGKQDVCKTGDCGFRKERIETVGGRGAVEQAEETEVADFGTVRLEPVLVGQEHVGGVTGLVRVGIEQQHVVVFAEIAVVGLDQVGAEQRQG